MGTGRRACLDALPNEPAAAGWSGPGQKTTTSRTLHSRKGWDLSSPAIRRWCGKKEKSMRKCVHCWINVRPGGHVTICHACLHAVTLLTRTEAPSNAASASNDPQRRNETTTMSEREKNISRD